MPDSIDFIVKGAKMVCTGCGAGITRDIRLPPDELRSKTELVKTAATWEGSIWASYRDSSNTLFPPTDYLSVSNRGQNGKQERMVYTDIEPLANIPFWPSCTYPNQLQTGLRSYSYLVDQTGSGYGCTFYPVDTWFQYKEDVAILGHYALTMESKLCCIRGGIISFVENGQIETVLQEAGYVTLDILLALGIKADQALVDDINAAMNYMEENGYDMPQMVIASMLGNMCEEVGDIGIIEDGYFYNENVYDFNTGEPYLYNYDDNFNTKFDVGDPRRGNWVKSEDGTGEPITGEQLWLKRQNDRIESSNKPGYTRSDFNHRGAGILQVTHQGTQEKFLEWVGDSNMDKRTDPDMPMADYIAKEYPAMSGMFFYCEDKKASSSTKPLNQYMIEQINAGYAPEDVHMVVSLYLKGTKYTDELTEIKEGKYTIDGSNIKPQSGDAQDFGASTRQQGFINAMDLLSQSGLYDENGYAIGASGSTAHTYEGS